MQTKLELYQKVTPLAHLGIWERKLLTGEAYWNTVVREILEVDEAYDPSLEPATGFYTEPEAVTKLIEKARETGDPQTAELQLRAASGALKWVRLRIRAGFENGVCTVIYGTIEDITADINLMTRLAEREEQFHQAFEFAPIGMALVSLKGEWIKVNKMLCQILGCETEQLLSRTFQELTHPEDLDADLHLMEQLVSGVIETYQMDKRYFHASGSIIWASLHVTLVRDADGKPLYFVSQIKDITERKHMEIERIKTLEIISAQNARLLNFAHIVSHNLRSHTGNIQMITDMIGKEKDDVEKDHLISMLGVNAANLQETLLHLNEVVDVQAHGKQALKRLKLSAEISKMTGVLSGSLKQAGAHVEVTIDPMIELDYDQAYLESIILNLLTNAIKYRAEERPLVIRVRAEKRGETILLEIEDNGIGIDLALHGHKLFGMYKTFHGNSDARGIGLFLVRNQVEVMGGRIFAESVPGQGTTFKIEL